MIELDDRLTQWINGLSGHVPALDQFMIAVSAFGVPILVLAVALQWWSGSDRRRTRHALIASGLAFILGLTINQFILFMLFRMRPYDAGITHLLIAPSADPSFPSDHATASFAIAAALLLQGLPKRGFAFLLAAILVSFSRVYIGIHYASDVLGGALTGIVAAIVVTLAYRRDTRLDRLLTGIL